MTPRFLPSRRAALGLIGGACAWPHLAAAAPVEVVSGRAFGTGWQIVAPSGAEVVRLAGEIETLFQQVDRSLSPWRADSCVSRFNAGPAQTWEVDPALTEVAVAALRIAEQSNGAFDPTVGPLVARWGFGPITEGGAPDWRAIEAGAQGVRKARADLTLDLCGIAKGWALDRAVAHLQVAGLDSFLFDLGGELRAHGRHPSGRDWQAAIASPLVAGQGAGILRLPAGNAVATSAQSEQSYMLNAQRYGHIIAPALQAPARGRLASVTVIAEDATMADGWATALFAAGEVAGPRLAREMGISALFLIDDRHTLHQQSTGRMAEFIL